MNEESLDDRMKRKQEESLKRKKMEEDYEKQIVSVSSLSGKLKSIYESGFTGGESTGWRNIDPLYTVRRGELTVITGIPGSGKTSWLDALVVNLATKKDWKFAMFSAENLPYERHISTLSQQFTGKPFREGITERMSPIDLMAADEFIDDHIKFISPNDKYCTIDGILDLAGTIDSRRKIDGLIIDPWNEINQTRESWVSETEYISMAISKIKRFMRKIDVHVWIVAHPQKLYKTDNGNYPVPTPYSISGSAHWWNKPDNAISIWRDFTLQNGQIQVNFQKIKYMEIGKIGSADLFFNKVNLRYYETEYECQTN